LLSRIVTADICIVTWVTVKVSVH